MSPDLSSERSAVLATYSNRRDAEIAIDRLEREGLEAFLSADDAAFIVILIVIVLALLVLTLLPG